jgi:hypothetical protein
MNTNTDGVSAISAELGHALDAARLALAEFAQQDDYLLAHGASLMSEDSHEILHMDTLRRIVAAAVAAERERWPDLIRQAMLDTAEDGDDEYAAQEADRITERLLCVLWPNTTDDPRRKASDSI